MIKEISRVSKGIHWGIWKERSTFSHIEIGSYQIYRYGVNNFSGKEKSKALLSHVNANIPGVFFHVQLVLIYIEMFMLRKVFLYVMPKKERKYWISDIQSEDNQYTP